MHADGGWDKNRTGSGKNSNSSYGGKNTGVRKNLKNATERGKTEAEITLQAQRTKRKQSETSTRRKDRYNRYIR